ncbi:hypothetical protein DH2020_039753 [Rehmannia glutinosa]|uniref:Calcium-dependent protein kinase n=1 Tax=Rehmannia glutinosa TaxID=99300 RepID=A0ABR0UV05_REHGL
MVKIEKVEPTKVEPVIVAKEEPKPSQATKTWEEAIKTDEKRHLKEHFNLGHKLGHGQFGTTFLCVERSTGKEYACKSIAKRKLLTQEDVDDVRREIEIMHHLSGNPNVISIKGAYEDAVAVHVVMELCAGGELFDRIVKRGHYSEKKAAELTRTIVGVIETCHSLGVMHRDLKPRIFCLSTMKRIRRLRPLISDCQCSLSQYDFGCTKFYREIFSDVVGSPYYVARKCFVALWARGRHPWPTISESAKDLVKKNARAGSKKAVNSSSSHPWVQVDGVAPDKPLDSAVLSRLTQFSAMDKLKKMALRVIAESLSEEEIAGLKEMFKMIDTDNSGNITFEELKASLKKCGANLNESEIYDLMKAADVDNSGTIDYGEFIAATLHLNKIEKEDHLFRAFSYFDKDGSGYITQDELQKACEEFGIEDSHLEEMIREVDQNNDGRIDYNEFVAMMQKRNADFGKKRYQNNFNIGFRRQCQFIDI